MSPRWLARLSPLRLMLSFFGRPAPRRASDRSLNHQAFAFTAAERESIGNPSVSATGRGNLCAAIFNLRGLTVRRLEGRQLRGRRNGLPCPCHLMCRRALPVHDAGHAVSASERWTTVKATPPAISRFGRPPAARSFCVRARVALGRV